MEFQDVDVNLPVEMDEENGKMPRQVTIRRASEKTMEEKAECLRVHPLRR